jgi:hypothetical protein
VALIFNIGASRNEDLVVVLSTTNLTSASTQEQQDESYKEEDQADRPQDADAGDDANDHQNQSKYNHEASFQEMHYTSQ